MKKKKKKSVTSGNALTTLSFVLPYREIQRAYGNRRFSQAKRDTSVTHEPATYGGHIRGMTLREREREKRKNSKSKQVQRQPKGNVQRAPTKSSV